MKEIKKLRWACWQFVFSCLYMMILVGACSNLVIGGSIDLWLLLLPSVCGCLASTFAQGIGFMSIEGIEVTVYKKVITVSVTHGIIIYDTALVSLLALLRLFQQQIP